tara:strand:- start:414 stop:1007 length:594 start_codon:yes stop_codon:yes gene_type:complete
MKDKFFATLDVEYTSNKGSMARNWSLPHEFPEVIEVGVVKFKNFNSKHFKKINLLFKSDKKLLSFYFQKLTKINQNYFNNFAKEPLGQYKKLNYFLKDVEKIFCIGTDKEMIEKNLYKKKYNFNFQNKIRDIRPLLAKKLDKKEDEIISSQLLNILGESKNLREHRALDDAMSVFFSLRIMSKKYGLSKKKINEMLP